MYRKLLVLFCMTFLVSCNCQKSANANDGEEEQAISSERIKVFLREKNFDIVANAKLVVAYDIQKSLIEGTSDEYSNKVVLKDTLAPQKAKKLLALLKNDTSYDWTQKGPFVDFNPERQFLVRDASKRIILLIDTKGDKMGFINLEGQKVVQLSAGFSHALGDL